ncbi:MAG TPA: hypothetical protein VFY06_08895 [Verrucomicrobiae bacterium]|nr:hypothetical protein [Verrucomicrobiae bacterium]
MNWLSFNSGKSTAAFNMALDEALLENASRLGAPVLRLYGWSEPAASFGYFQKYTDVERATSLRPLIRRPTGGGIVPHDADWTYSFIVPPGHEWYSLKAEESYRRIHEWIQAALAGLTIQTELAPAPRTSAPGQCFAGHEKCDLLWRGRKIAGAAQRRNLSGLLIQGSIQPPPFGCSYPDWKTMMAEAASRKFHVIWKEFVPDKELRMHADDLARQRYSQDCYNRKR